MSTTTTPVEAPIWLSQFYAKVDKLDTEGVAAAFSTDASMRYGSNEAAVGPDAIRGGLTYLFTHYAGIQHEFLSVWDTGSTLMVEANVTYRTQDQREVTVPALTVIEHRDGGVIDGMRIFIDPSPVEVD
jgi:SnoaL-like domain